VTSGRGPSLSAPDLMRACLRFVPCPLLHLIFAPPCRSTRPHLSAVLNLPRICPYPLLNPQPSLRSGATPRSPSTTPTSRATALWTTSRPKGGVNGRQPVILRSTADRAAPCITCTANVPGNPKPSTHQRPPSPPTYALPPDTPGIPTCLSPPACTTLVSGTGSRQNGSPSCAPLRPATTCWCCRLIWARATSASRGASTG
jgi:hypothetical protein